MFFNCVFETKRAIDLHILFLRIPRSGSHLSWKWLCKSRYRLLKQYCSRKRSFIIDPPGLNILISYRRGDVSTSRTWQDFNKILQRAKPQRETKALDAEIKAHGRRIEMRGRGRSGEEKRCSGGWDKLKELSKLSTSTAGRLSPTPPTISLSRHSATCSRVYLCVRAIVRIHD